MEKIVRSVAASLRKPADRRLPIFFRLITRQPLPHRFASCPLLIPLRSLPPHTPAHDARHAAFSSLFIVFSPTTSILSRTAPRPQHVPVAPSQFCINISIQRTWLIRRSYQGRQREHQTRQHEQRSQNAFTGGPITHTRRDVGDYLLY